MVQKCLSMSSVTQHINLKGNDMDSDKAATYGPVWSWTNVFGNVGLQSIASDDILCDFIWLWQWMS